jgi:hypothetical protein
MVLQTKAEAVLHLEILQHKNYPDADFEAEMPNREEETMGIQNACPAIASLGLAARTH